MKRPQILFICTSFSSFVINDLRILGKCANVRKHRYQQGKSFSIHLWSQFKLFIWLIVNILSVSCVYCWFADYHSFFPALFSRIFNKKFYLVLGGYDVVHLPKIRYGSLKNPIRSFCAKFSITSAECNLAVSDYVRKQAIKLVPYAKITTVYNGITTDTSVKVQNKKKDLVLTVGVGHTLQRIRLKGVDFFCEVARHLPKFSFLVIGISEDARIHLDKLPQNVEIIGWLEFSQLIKYYQEAKVYCQFSLLESFGAALAEAMFYECIPVGFNVGAIPEIVGESGYIISTRNSIEAAKFVRFAAMEQKTKGVIARRRIESSFNSQIRENKLRNILNL